MGSTTCRDGRTSQQFQGKVYGYHACGTPEITDYRCQQLLNGGGNSGGGHNNCGSWNNYCNGNGNGNHGNNNNNNCGSWNNYCNGNGNCNNNNNCGSWNNYCNGNGNNNNNNNNCGRRKGGSTRKGSKVTSTRGKSSNKGAVSL